MNLVFAHYHLNAGGVTQVMVNQLRSLAGAKGEGRPARVGVLYGGRHNGWPENLWERFESGSVAPIETVLMPVPALDYDTLPNHDDQALASEVQAALAANGFPPDDSLLHIHNHAVGKNASWPGAIELLAAHGYRMLLQMHDFVEDFRPANYRHLARAWRLDQPRQIAGKQYPLASGIHYAALTERDRKLLAGAGVPDYQLHTLPNPVGDFDRLKSHREVAGPVREQLGIPTDASLRLYPVRGIRRKNLGELLLHAAISPADTWHAVTLAPMNPLELPSFERWKGLAAGLELRCLFDTCGGGPCDFLDTLSAADAIVTTSVAEGFGMVFLESWLAGKPLVGRDLPGITGDFKRRGLKFDGLYQSLMVPLELIERRDDLAEALQVAYDWACEQYGVQLAERAEVEGEVAKLLAAGSIDFSLLPSRFQESLIRAVAKEPAATRETLFRANPGLGDQLACRGQSAAAIDHNARLVRSTYSLATIGKQLADAYATIWRDHPPAEVQSVNNGESILEQFLRVDRLHAIRFEE